MTFISHTCHTICFRLCSYNWMMSRLTIPRNSWLTNCLWPCDCYHWQRYWRWIVDTAFTWRSCLRLLDKKAYHTRVWNVSALRTDRGWTRIRPFRTALTPNKSNSGCMGCSTCKNRGQYACQTGAISFRKPQPCFTWIFPIRTLSRRFRTNDQQLRYRRLSVDMFTDTMYANSVSRQGNKCAQVFSTSNGWVCAYPMRKNRKLMRHCLCYSSGKVSWKPWLWMVL